MCGQAIMGTLNYASSVTLTFSLLKPEISFEKNAANNVFGMIVLEMNIQLVIKQIKYNKPSWQEKEQHICTKPSIWF